MCAATLKRHFIPHRLLIFLPLPGILSLSKQHCPDLNFFAGASRSTITTWTEFAAGAFGSVMVHPISAGMVEAESIRMTYKCYVPGTIGYFLHRLNRLPASIMPTTTGTRSFVLSLYAPIFCAVRFNYYLISRFQR
jgi:hypothetical protein